MITKEAIEAGVAAIDRPIHPDDVERILVAALAAMPGPAVKLEWVPIIADGRDIEAVTEFGKYTISVDSSFAGGTHYLWTPDQHEYDDDHHSEHRGMTSARAAAQADYEARIRAALTPAPDLASENERLRAALEWYGEQAAATFRLKAIPDALMAIVAALSLDSGKRAKAALERT